MKRLIRFKVTLFFHGKTYEWEGDSVSTIEAIKAARAYYGIDTGKCGVRVEKIV